MVAEAQFFVLKSQGQQPFFHEILPIGKPFEVRARLAEEFQLHLLEFARAECEIARSDFVPEGFSDLADAEGNFLSGRSLDIFKIDENALGRLRTEIDRILGVFRDALEGLEHQVELAYAGEVVFAAGRAGNLVFFDKFLHLFIGPAVNRGSERDALLCGIVFNQLVGAEPLVAFLAVHQRIGKAAEMAGSHPGLWIHQDCAVKAHVVGTFLDKFLPPGFLDIVLEFNSQGAVIPCVRETAVDFGARENESS